MGHYGPLETKPSVLPIRLQIFCGALIITSLMCAGFVVAFPGGTSTIPGVICLTTFVLLTFWIAVGFCMAMSGLMPLMTATRHARDVSNLKPTACPTEPSSRVALLVPIYNESPAAVMAGIQATVESIIRTGAGHRYDIFILSDTTNPEVWLEEEVAWVELRRMLGVAEPAIHYRHRTENRGRKSGNIGEFLERWGSLYKYFVILDADSTMAGRTLETLVSHMESDPRLGILQAPPVPEGSSSLWARIQQFSARVYGPLFNYGLVAWAGNDGNYWGHNAIIRTSAFIKHCGLSALPGSEPLGGEVLSHDFVEAALMRRAGFKVQLAADLEGSFEQCPTTIEDHARRDQRWCQGNLQHLRIAVAPNWHPVSRWHLLSGAMSYMASPIWMLFLFVGLVCALVNDGDGNLVAALSVFVAAMMLLLLPKFLAVAVLVSHDSSAYGGRLNLIASAVLETYLAMLVAPIMMLYHSQFVLLTLIGKKVRWHAQWRGDNGISWKQSMRSHGVQMLVGLVATFAMMHWWPGLFFWAIPLLVGLVIAVALGKCMASPRVGNWLVSSGLLLTPEITSPPRLLRRRDALEKRYANFLVEARSGKSLFAEFLTQPSLYRLHEGLLNANANSVTKFDNANQKLAVRKVRLARKMIRKGGVESIPLSLRRDILGDSTALRKLHAEYWSRA